MITQLNAQQQFLNSQQFSQRQASSAFVTIVGGGGCGGAGGSGVIVRDFGESGTLNGGFGSFVGGIPRGPSPTCRIGKITPKSGYILDYDHPDNVRAKVRTDYTLWQQFLIWWGFNW